MWAAEAWQADGRARQEAAAGWKWSRRPSMSFIMAALKKILRTSRCSAAAMSDLVVGIFFLRASFLWLWMSNCEMYG
jgi:hypothetical protein